MQRTAIIAALGPTNTGKTHRAIARMLEHDSGMLGLPLRLLAREVYDKVVAHVGADEVALITGEEKITPRRARFFVCTVEAMPMDRAVDFVGIDEIQLAEHHERGHVFTDRLLHARGTLETWFMGSDTMLPLIQQLVPTAEHRKFPRLSTLHAETSFTLGSLPKRSAVVGFSADRVYELAEKLKARKGGAAVVLGALSPRARNAQVAMYQEGDVDYLVATDAIGMGLNLDIDRVAFADMQKFDGKEIRPLELAELGQIAGRAGRHQRDGAFATFARPALPLNVQRAISDHRYPAVRTLVWRNSSLDFDSPQALLQSLLSPPRHPRLRLISDAEDTETLKTLLNDEEIRPLISSATALKLLWDVCQIPDYRKLLAEQHAYLVREIFIELSRNGSLSEDFIAPRIERLRQHSGDIDTIMSRIRGVRTWTYVANHSDWSRRDDNTHHNEMAARARAIEDELSDALHQALLERFVQRRRSYSVPQPSAPNQPAKRSKHTAEHHFHDTLRALQQQLAEREHGPDLRTLLNEAKADDFTTNALGQLCLGKTILGELRRGRTLLEPRTVSVLSQLDSATQMSLDAQLASWQKRLLDQATGHFLSAAIAMAPSALRGIVYQLREGLGVAPAAAINALYASLSQPQQKQLASQGFVPGLRYTYIRAQLRPSAQRARLPVLRAYYLEKGKALLTPAQLVDTPFDTPELLQRAVLPARDLNASLWLLLGYHREGAVALRVDLFEKLSLVAQGLKRAETAPGSALSHLSGVVRSHTQLSRQESLAVAQRLLPRSAARRRR